MRVRITIHAFFALWTLLASVAFAQSGERVALVIGNASYPTAALPNPKNDAQAMSRLLGEAGFAVDLRIDTSVEALRQAIVQFGEQIKNPKVKFAVFYYAGHGVQLNWHNYLIPVTARIRSAADVLTQTVDIGELMKFMGEAKSKNYVVILDACRDDPFGAAYRPPAKGLSQFDAPSGSVLAYATAPGKVAFDGEGVNGLYTAYLLKEFAVKGAKIEDAFKRTRLNVRLASNGKQTPWETTSLEEDLYLFPAPAKRLTDAEQDKLLEEELYAWAKVKGSTNFLELAEFIRRYPSGNVSELAASRLNRLLAQEQRREDRILASRSESTRDAERQRRLLEEALRVAAENAERARADAKRADEARVLAEQERLIAEREAINSKLAAQQQAERRRLEREAVERAQAAAAASAQEQAARLELARQNAAEVARVEAAHVANGSHESPPDSSRKSGAVATSTPAAATPQPALAGAGEQDTTEPELLAATPFFSGSSANLRRYSVGDEFRFRVIDRYTGLEKPLSMKVTATDVAADRVEFNGGEYVSDLMGNTLTNLVGHSSTPRQFYPAELVVGKRWTTRFKQVRADRTHTFKYDLKVVGKERVTVPAGTFDTYKIEARGFNVELNALIERKIWLAPGVNADIAHEVKVVHRNGFLEQNDRQELVSLKQAARIPSSSLAAR